MASCRSCGAHIIWATSKNNKPFCVDAEPHLDGNVELVANSKGFDAVVYGGENQRGNDLFGTQRYRSHFVTCPNADAWKKR